MKKLLFFLFVSAVLHTHAQQKLVYAYDAAGNRISRTIVIPPQGVKSARGNNPTPPSAFYDTLGEKQVKLYPNPVTTSLTVEVTGFDEKSAGEYLILDMQGKQLVKGKMQAATFQVNMSAYTPGTYLLHLILNGEKTVWKVIKK